MRIPRIYQSTHLAVGAEIALTAEASQHLLKVLRLREGAPLIIFNGEGGSFRGELSAAQGKSAQARLLEYIPVSTESPLKIHIGLGISKGERMDYAVQKLVETGVHSITPLVTEHTVVKLDATREQTRLQHWQGIITSACEQCGRVQLPHLHAITAAPDWIEQVTSECKLVFDAEGTVNLKSITPGPADVAVLIGPEGGLHDSEVQFAQLHGFLVARLGPRVLRTETAAVAICAALQTLWGDY